MITDLFLLKCSKELDIQNTTELRVDLELTTAPAPPGNGLTGKVTYGGRPICNATVVVVDAQLNMVTDTRSNQDGVYLIAGLSSQLYGLTATATGFRAADLIFISLMENELKIANIELKKTCRRFYRLQCRQRPYCHHENTLIFYDDVTAL